MWITLEEKSSSRCPPPLPVHGLTGSSHPEELISYVGSWWQLKHRLRLKFLEWSIALRKLLCSPDTTLLPKRKGVTSSSGHLQDSSRMLSHNKCFPPQFPVSGRKKQAPSRISGWDQEQARGGRWRGTSFWDSVQTARVRRMGKDRNLSGTKAIIWCWSIDKTPDLQARIGRGLPGQMSYALVCEDSHPSGVWRRYVQCLLGLGTEWGSNHFRVKWLPHQGQDPEPRTTGHFGLFFSPW